MNTDTVNKPPARAPSKSQGVGLLVKVFQILDLFTEEQSAWTQVELARETGLARSTLSRLVRFLCANGYLMEQRGRYVLGFAAIDLGRRAQLQFNLVDLCYDLLEDVARRTGETAILTGYDESRGCVVCVAQIPSRHDGLRVFENIGNSYPLHAGATSKAVLAFLPERDVSKLLAGDLTPVNPSVRMTAADLRKQIGLIRKRGCAVTTEETFPGVVGVAVPILTPRGLPLGSIAMAGPVARMDEAAVAHCVAVMREIGEKAAARLAGEAALAGEDA